ncbi:hypothetical protein U9M48_039061 [Paspalum notatum var. saurae]|uniref:NAC domain-containing protein n=1 Tax=Paspalum notatum var. saurae TaxID=547442 RepID=A0AAQ3UIU0_PASNO
MAPAPAPAVSSSGLPPGYHFLPEDKEIVGCYLVPRILGKSLPPSEILDVDPLSAPPPVLLKRHGRKLGQDAFFFAEGQAMSSKGSRQKRTCAGGGTWQGQTTGEAMRVRGCDMDVEWRKKSFNFHEDDKKGSTGWVMHEYAVTAPPKLAASLLRVYRIRFSGHGKNAQKRKRGGQEDSSSDSEGQEDVSAPAKTQRREAAVQDNSAVFVGEGLLEAQSEHVSGSSPWMGMMAGREVVEDSDALFNALFMGEDREVVDDNAALFTGECPLVAQSEHVASSSPWLKMMGDCEAVEDNSALFVGECPLAAQTEHVVSYSPWLNMMGDREVVEDNAALFVGEWPLAGQSEPVLSSSPWKRMMGDHKVVDNSALFMGECPLVVQSEHVLSSSPWKRMGDLFNNGNPPDASDAIAGMAESTGTPSEFGISTVFGSCSPLELPVGYSTDRKELRKQW